jgi:hypothetical protein
MKGKPEGGVPEIWRVIAQGHLGDLLAGREVRPRLEGTQRTLPELVKLLDIVSVDLAGEPS